MGRKYHIEPDSSMIMSGDRAAIVFQKGFEHLAPIVFDAINGIVPNDLGRPSMLDEFSRTENDLFPDYFRGINENDIFLK